MKYVVVLADGMADYPLEALEGRTPMEMADTPNMDFLAQHGMVGMVRTVPKGMPPGSDTANLSVMGFDPEKHYSGRSPLEAVSMGIDLQPTDVTFRCNLVTLSDAPRYEDAVMLDYSAGEIESEQAAELIASLNQAFATEKLRLYPGIYYRHCLVVSEGETGSILTPPHDISGKCVGTYLPKGTYGELLLELQKKSYAVLRNHPVNVKRRAEGKSPATSCWFWGEGTKPQLPSFVEKFGIHGGVISAVDLIKGIGICAGLESVDVEGATGNVHTNYKGKADAALDGLLNKDWDYVYIHLEGPDECGHRGELDYKVQAIEQIDKHILGPILEGLEQEGEDYAVMVLPDHPTPMTLRTHTAEPVPFVLYRKGQLHTGTSTEAFSEALAGTTGLKVNKGCKLVELLINGEDDGC